MEEKKKGMLDVLSADEIHRYMKAIGQPMTLREIGIDPTDANMKKLVDSMMVVWGKRPEAHWPIIYDALQRIKE